MVVVEAMRTEERVWGAGPRERILDAAFHRFASRGFRVARLEDIASDAGMTRPGLLRHFSSKEELFLEVHKAAALSFRSYMDAPDGVLERGFFETLRFWLTRAGDLADGADETYRLILIGKFTTDLDLQERISRFWLSEDPEGTVDFVEFGQRMGEIDSRLDPLVVAAIVDWVVEGFCRSVAASELDRARLFHNRCRDDGPERFEEAVATVISTLRSGLA